MMAMHAASAVSLCSVRKPRQANTSLRPTAIMPASKTTSPASTAVRQSLLSRPLDLFYFIFFAFHILNFICIDGQSFWPSWLVPSVLQEVKRDYIRDSGDVFVQAFDRGDPRYVWFQVSVYASLVYQNPVFIAGAWMLWKDDKRVYPIIASYGILASTTTLQCLATVLYGAERQQLTRANLSFLVKAYVPFALIPLLMLIDMTIRTIRLIDRANNVVGSKSKQQ